MGRVMFPIINQTQQHASIQTNHRMSITYSRMETIMDSAEVATGAELVEAEGGRGRESDDRRWFFFIDSHE